MPKIVFIVVDLPEALPPSRETMAPLGTQIDTFCNAWTCP